VHSHAAAGAGLNRGPCEICEMQAKVSLCILVHIWAHAEPIKMSLMSALYRFSFVKIGMLPVNDEFENVIKAQFVPETQSCKIVACAGSGGRISERLGTDCACPSLSGFPASYTPQRRRDLCTFGTQLPGS